MQRRKPLQKRYVAFIMAIIAAIAGCTSTDSRASTTSRESEQTDRDLTITITVDNETVYTSPGQTNEPTQADRDLTATITVDNEPVHTTPIEPLQTVEELTLKLHPRIPVANIQIPDKDYIRYFHNFPRVLDSMTRFLYTYFADDFDFIAFAYNEDSRHIGAVYRGIYVGVQNDTMGIGERMYDDTSLYGSAGRLQGVMHFPNRKNLNTGAALHEFIHRWANYAVPTDDWSHWGEYSSPRGLLGGFDAIVPLGGNRYRIVYDETVNDPIPYSPLELYLAGLIPASEVPDIQVAINTEYLSGTNTDFTADRVEVYSIERIIREHGPRIPNFRNSPKQFRVLFVVLSPGDLTDAEWADIDRVTSEFGFAGDDGNPNYNFWEATGGRARIQFDNIAESLIREP